MKFHSCFSFCSSFPNSRPAISTISTGEQKHGNLQIFSSRELEIATHDFSSSNKVGEGAFGSVYMGQLKNGSIVAVKVLSVELESMRGEREFISELAALSDIRHENLVKLQGCCVDGANRYLVYDYMENNSLTQTLLGKEQNRMKFSWEARRNISFGVARGLAYIHEEVKPHILHRDIKASNILLDKDFTPKVADFGLSRILRDNTSHVSTRVAGTLGYLAPEYALSGHLTRKSDVYSFGVLLLEIISGRSAVDFDLELGEHFLVQKAWEAYNENKLLQIIDPILIMNFLEEEEEEDALRFLIVGLLCVQEIAKLRPQMSTCVKMMVNEIDIKDIQICQPGCVSNLMGVKLHHSQTCESSSSSRDATYTMSTRSSVYFK
ncbi:putative serine/threonine-protein kinase isoform X1 [Ricinus communis]|uniref:putative serine/threonine-protein kinase isoform X1 n=1 Tax=Ricinus communis TaxID=3988 RepID=UPI00201B0CFF|nr:putative serine/threonine-protein kinase isoform X1 [Ricinus communis]